MCRKIFLVLLFFFLLIVFFIVRFYLSASAMQPAKDISIPEIDEVNNVEEIAKAFVDYPMTRGLSIGVYDKGEVQYYNYGQISKKDKEAPTEESIFEIASISKTFTGALLAQMVQEGKVNYEDPISKYLPEELTNWPDSLSITLEELATHYSGFPRLPENHIIHMVRNMKDPYKSYKQKHLEEYLKTYTPKSKSLRKADYSNLGMGLLGDILAQVEGTDYPSLLKDKILDPLGMTNSYSGFDKEKNQIKGHNGKGKTTPAWKKNILHGSGAIRSTIEDLIKYAVANLENEGAFAEAHRPRKTWDETKDIGLAWITIHSKKLNRDILFHNGGSGGFRSSLYIDKANQRAIVVLNNTIQDVDAIGLRILQLLDKKSPPVEIIDS